jgi:hypothetical protein
MDVRMKAQDRVIIAYGCLAAMAIAWQWLIYLNAIPFAVAQTVDVRPIANTFVETALGTLATILSVVGAIGVRIALGYVGLQNSRLERDLNDRLDAIIHKGYEFGLTTAQNEMAKRGAGLSQIKLDNWFMKVVADYVQPRAMEILARFKVDRTKLEEMILARAPSYFQIAPSPDAVDGGVAASPAITEANREVGKPASAAARQDPPRNEPFGDAPVSLG